MELRLEPGGNFYLLLIIVYAYCISVCKTSNQCFLVFFITECLQKKEFHLLHLNKQSYCRIHPKFLKL